MDPATIVAVVGLLVGAFKSGLSVYQKFKAKKKAKAVKQAASHESLDQALSNSGALVRRKYQEDFQKLGKSFEKGDAIGREQLYAQVVSLQQSVISSLQYALSNGRTVINVINLVGSSNAVRQRSMNALTAQYQRFMQARPLPITLAGNQTIEDSAVCLEGTDIAAITTAAWNCKLFYQDVAGRIRGYQHTAGQWQRTKPICRARMFSPLAAVCWDSGKEIRIYVVSVDGHLQEWCHSPGISNWYPGLLTNLNVPVASGSKLAAVCCDEGIFALRVYYQDPASDRIHELGFGNPWKRLSTFANPCTGTGLSAVLWKQDGLYTRVYCQSSSGEIEEYCSDCDMNWFKGEVEHCTKASITTLTGYTLGALRTDPMPLSTPISSCVWNHPTLGIRVYCQDQERNIIALRMAAAEGIYEGKIVGPLRPGAHSSAVHWNFGKNIRVYHSDDASRIHERCQDGGGPWFRGAFDSTSKLMRTN